MALHPAGHRVLVKRDDVEATSAGGIILQVDQRMEKAGMIMGTLVEVGPSAWKVFGPGFDGAPWAKTGDRVMFAKFAGSNLVDPETKEEFVLMNDEDIIATISGA